jgi:pilus assembly protein CpaB
MGIQDGEAGAALRRATERGTRRTGVRAAIFLVVSAAAAVGAALLLARYLDARTSALRVPTVPVVVAAIDLAEASELRAEQLTIVNWPANSVPRGAVSDPAALAGRILTGRLVKDEPVLESRLASAEAGRGLAALLPQGMRAVAVRVDDVVGVAGFIHPGDNVDVIVTFRPTDAAVTRPISKVVLQGIRVLAVGKEVARVESTLDKAITATVATLMVDSPQAEKLALAASRGQILLALRSRLDVAVVNTPGIEPSELVAARVAPAPAPEKGRRAATAAPDKKAEVVEILRGDLFEQRDFDKKGGRR